MLKYLVFHSSTPRGGTIDSMNLPKAYMPEQYEADIYSLWEQVHAFEPQGNGEPFSIVMPPPNANGNLHIGHALTLAIEDITIRFQRLQGRRVLFVPGADHAGFETQVVYERTLEKEGKSRFDYSRDELYAQIWDFVAQNRGNYESQFRRLGASCDWNSYTYTLDPKVIARAYKTFKKLWDDGLVYRGERLVNFCTHHGTAFADIEVEHKEEKGSLWEIRYPLSDGSGEVVVATTRPETMLGDSAVAVHPEDERYKHIVGKMVLLPLTGREIPVIADDFVDQAFGTGAVKITPAHDPNDFDAGKRHQLAEHTVISFEGTLTGEIPEQYKGLTVEEGRKAVVADLKEQGYLVDIKHHTHNVGHCYKCGTVLQPLLKEQWFVNIEPLAARAIEALEQGSITFYPDSKRVQLISYLKNLRDWNISRQIAWGIAIPAFQNVDDPNDWIFDEQVEKESFSVGGKTYRRDSDVFDTWFSSSSWPFATLGYPDTQEKAEFYPNSLMETGYDIMYPWVSRMIMMGLYITDEIPFKNVYLHGLVLDEHGQKMSKSKGNVVNPMEAIDEYGSDALRMGIIAGQAPGTNQPFNTGRVQAARNFCNKLWNISRYIAELTGNDAAMFMEQPNPTTPADHWILTKLQHSQESITQLLEEYRFSEAYETLYHFVWDEFADWYIEASKSQTNTSVLAWTLYSVLHMAHPFAPFVTETIWQTLRPEEHEVTVLAASRWPRIAIADAQLAADFETLKAVISEIREVSSSVGITNPEVRYQNSAVIAANDSVVAKLCRVRSIFEKEQGSSGLSLTATNELVWLDMSESEVNRYKDQLDEKKTSLEASKKLLEGRLSNESYVANAPEHLVTESRTQLQQLDQQLAAIELAYKRIHV